MARVPAIDSEAAPLSHNLAGQRLGRKGRDTRDRILAATETLLADPHGVPVSLSAVAREASLAMSTLYLYFGDLSELLIALLEQIMGSAEQSYIAPLRTRWADEELAARCTAFVLAFHAFWERHTRILHLRNSYTSGEDMRMSQHRVDSARPVINLLIAQMDGEPGEFGTIRSGLATALFTGTERLVTVATDTVMRGGVTGPLPNTPNLLRAQARLLELGIRDGRGAAPGERYDLS